MSLAGVFCNYVGLGISLGPYRMGHSITPIVAPHVDARLQQRLVPLGALD